MGIFAVLAIVLTLVMSLISPSAHDIGVAVMGGPIFLLAACMGLRRSPAWTVSAADETEDAE
jgi:hypothetical protein